MDLTGAVDLSLRANTLTVQELDHEQQRELKSLAVAKLPPSRQDIPHLVQYVRGQTDNELICLYAASILTSYVTHLNSTTLSHFALEQSPDAITLGKLATLRICHDGSRGESFEFAVADAVNSSTPGPVDAIRIAIQQLGVDVPRSDIRIVLLGLEKLAAPKTALEAIREMIPSNATVRSGTPGRPMSRDAALRRLASDTWTTLRQTEALFENAMLDERVVASPRAGWNSSAPSHADALRRAQVRASTSQIARADALVIAGTWIIPTSMKVSPEAVSHYGWKDVPLWITAGARSWSSRDGEPKPDWAAPVVIANMGWPQNSHFMRAFDEVDAALTRIKTGRWGGATAPGHRVVYRAISRYVDEPVSVAIEALRRRVDERVASIVSDQGRAARGQIVVPVVDNPDVVSAYREEQSEDGLWLLHKHLFIPAAA